MKQRLEGKPGSSTAPDRTISTSSPSTGTISTSWPSTRATAVESGDKKEKKKKKGDAKATAEADPKSSKVPRTALVVWSQCSNPMWCCLCSLRQTQFGVMAMEKLCWLRLRRSSKLVRTL